MNDTKYVRDFAKSDTLFEISHFSVTCFQRNPSLSPFLKRFMNVHTWSKSTFIAVLGNAQIFPFSWHIFPHHSEMYDPTTVLVIIFKQTHKSSIKLVYGSVCSINLTLGSIGKMHGVICN